MRRYVNEMLDGVVDVELEERKHHTIVFKGTGTHAGLEIEF